MYTYHDHDQCKTVERNLETSLNNPISLISPPAINRTTDMPCTPKQRQSENINDLLNTLDIDANPSANVSTLTSIEKEPRSVATVTLDANETGVKVNQSTSESTPTATDEHTRSVVTNSEEITQTEQSHVAPSIPISRETPIRSVITDLDESTNTEQVNTTTTNCEMDKEMPRSVETSTNTVRINVTDELKHGEQLKPQSETKKRLDQWQHLTLVVRPRRCLQRTHQTITQSVLQ